ncbi:MAG: hypothetical protein ACRERE_23050 [Candidatus Entotheonellia bacterium]
MADRSPRLGVIYLAFLQHRFVDEVQLTIAAEPWPCEIATANDANDRVQMIERNRLATASTVEEVTFGMQEVATAALVWITPQVEPYSDVIATQKADQFFDQP